MSEDIAVRFGTMCEILFMVAAVILLVIFVPVLKFFCYFRVNISILVYKVNTFINIDYDMEQEIDAFTALEYRRNHRDTEQLAEKLIIEFVTALFQFVIHIERTNHTQVHINELRS